jgi:glycosyltransferase involved in cell wall biosynthesis
LKILHINTFEKSGGAAIAAFRLHDAMRVSGIDSKYLVLNKTENDRSDIKTVSRYSRYKNKINGLFESNATKNMQEVGGDFSSFKYGIKISKKKEIIEADIIYLHWINSFVNYSELKKILKTGKPVFWFMHDMFAITGGCHHSYGCSNYETQCCKCRYNTGSLLTDLSVRQYKKKKRIYKQFSNLMFIAPSKWLYDCAKKSSLTENKQVYHIPHLIDANIFKPVCKETARQIFSLGKCEKIIGFGADSALNNPYKGWNYLKEALQILSGDETLKDMKIELLIFGSNYSKEIADDIPFSVHFLGRLYDEYSLVIAYNCMDIFVIPSIAENFPNTILESLSCDTPVVGFNIGGIPDMINENTGYLAEYRNSSDLAKGISFLLKKEKLNVRKAINTYFPESIVEKHKKIWNDKTI